ncbi:MAG TPA: hypothetical protein PKM21_15955 [Anaerolineales bacterium]|nr:hypothetical protein [Anaerolineales bacterium]
MATLIVVQDERGRTARVSQAELENPAIVRLALYNKKGRKLSDDPKIMRKGDPITINRARIASVIQ